MPSAIVNEISIDYSVTGDGTASPAHPPAVGARGS
jgi:hypothetical protein